MQLVIASNNQHKIVEIKNIIGPFFEKIVSMGEIGCNDDIIEDGTTFEENALIKARYIADKYNCAAIADDSGLEVLALDGQPGIYSARYSGVHGDDEANNDKLLDVMDDVTGNQRAAQYVCSIALCRPGQDEIVTRGVCAGRILRHRQGTGGFGYDSLFYMDGYQCTMAQLPMETKNQISHRYHALLRMKAVLDQET